MNGSVFSSCLEASLQGQAILNDNGEFLFVNRAFCEHVGYTKEELLLLSIESFVIYEANEDLMKKEPIIKRGMQQKQVEKLILHGNGYLQTTLFTVTDVSDLNQGYYHVQLDKIVTTFDDVDFSMLESKLRDRDEVRLPKKILDGIKDTIITIRLDGQFLYANEAAEKLFNRSMEELLSNDFWTYLKQNNDEELLSKFYQLLAGEEYTQFEVYKKDQDEWFDVRAYRSDDQVTLYFINISNRKKMEKELKESEMNYRSLVEKSPETISVHNGKEIIYINPAGKKLFGIRSFSEGALNLSEIVVAQDQARMRENYRMLLTGKKEMTNSVYTLKRLDGKKFDAEATTTLITFKGKPAFRTILKDLSERKKVDDLIRKSDKLSVVAQLAAGVAHEIRNPLTTVKGFLQLFQKEQEVKPFYLSLVMEELERVEAIIYEYLTLAKPNVESVFSKIDIQVLLEQILTLTKAQSNMNNVTLEFEYEQVPAIYGLEKQLKQVFINLLRNAIEALTDKGTIHVRILKHPDNQVCIQVEDNGCGIPSERIDRLGEPFYSTKEKGTGLGLMVCYKIIEHHNGVLNIYSEAGKGTTLEVILPASN
ncbi:PAS domain-containing sensor histidine kinase [Halalkalibacter alkalisediminis]|uniref:histidine kinase n=1 Tax=Halalkalibacter alkalisediminis TaxID=935616 RepID=A0ABV6NBJ6_9BACI|nr:PAS domain-containing sensor histidine kinase [Halalkalibacter alkalisediminis]